MTLVEQIKDKLDIVQFIGSYIQLKPAGKNFKANCPFHGEKTPSFMVSPERQRWHCFGSCSEGGDIITFLMKYDNLEFHEALKILAEKAGVEIKKTNPQEQKQFGILYDINDAVKNFYKDELKNSPDVLKYLGERGLKQETIDEFEIGFAPNSYDSQTIHLINMGYDVKDIERAGVNFKNDRGQYTDRLRGRIIFPIANHAGKTVGFSGRILPQFDTGETGKYVNSPETLIYNKSKILYGLYKTKNFIREAKRAVLVEGQMDFLMCWQDGLKNVAATSGTALTADHLLAVKKQVDEVIFCFDSDEAGLKATERGIDLANNLDLNVKILVLKEYKDPADAVCARPGGMLQMTERAMPAMEFYFDKYLGTTNNQQPTTNDIGEAKKNIRVILGKIKNLASPIEKSHWLRELSGRAKVEEKTLLEEMEKLVDAPSAEFGRKKLDQATFGAEPKLGRREMISRRIVSLLAAKAGLEPLAKDYLECLSPPEREMYKNLFGGEKISSQAVSEELAMLSMAPIDVSEENKEKLEEELKGLLRELKMEYLKEEVAGLKELISQAEKNNDERSLSSHLKRFDELSKMIQNYRI